MGSLFKSKTKEVKTSNDPYENMPDYLKEQLEAESGMRMDILGSSKDIAAELGNNPREIAGMNENEQQALADVNTAGDKASARGDAAWEANQGNTYDPATFDAGYEKQGATDIGRGYENGEFDSGYTGDRLTEALGGRDFNSAYTDDVVDTTLAGMDRQAQRETLRRESQGAGIGGTSNTRTAVGNAVADQLTGMNMSQQEAALRDKAHQFGVDSDFKRAGMFDSSDQAKAGLSLQEQDMADKSAQFGAGFDADNAFKEAAFQDSMNQFGSEMSLEEQLAGDASNQFGAKFGLDKAAQMDAFAKSGLGNDMSVADWIKGYGSEERGLDQSQMDADRNSEADAMSWLSGIYSGAKGTAAPVGNTQTGQVEKPSMASQILGGVTAVAGAVGSLSDENAKQDIVSMEHGLNAFKDVTPATYEYKPGMPTEKRGRTAGLMAQDVAHIPGAVERGADGYLRVDSYPIVATAIAAIKELDRRTAPYTSYPQAATVVSAVDSLKKERRNVSSEIGRESV